MHRQRGAVQGPVRELQQQRQRRHHGRGRRLIAPAPAAATGDALVCGGGGGGGGGGGRKQEEAGQREEAGLLEGAPVRGELVGDAVFVFGVYMLLWRLRDGSGVGRGGVGGGRAFVHTSIYTYAYISTHHQINAPLDPAGHPLGVRVEVRVLRQSPCVGFGVSVHCDGCGAAWLVGRSVG